MICDKCGKEFSNITVDGGIKHRLYGRKHCLECLPIGEHNTPIGRLCKKCGAIINNRVTMNRKRINLSSRKYCLKMLSF